MSFFSQLTTRALSWWQDTPLPSGEVKSTPVFQTWFEFDTQNAAWRNVEPLRPERNAQHSQHQSSPLTVLTWNVDSTSPSPELRMEKILTRAFGISPAVDILFLQEVSRAGLSSLLQDERIRHHWFLSDSEQAVLKGQSFVSITLLSKRRFSHPTGSMTGDILGPVWRVHYPSRFQRDALCCDVFVRDPTQSHPTRIRLINVHLDSLPIQPSLRPQQVSVVAALLRSAGRGLVAGDFNPVLPDDESLIKANGLVDTWSELCPDDPGYTWGIDGKQPFPPNRLDKIATLGLRPLDITVIHPDGLDTSGSDSASGEARQDADEIMPWSDHSGLLCTFKLVE